MIARHTHRVVFGRRVDGCPRCAQLAAGAPVVRWAAACRRWDEARRLEEIRAHDCKARGCGPVCTAFDW